MKNHLTYWLRRIREEGRVQSRHLLHGTDSPILVSLSIAVGVFLGILPIWGFQTITAIAFSYILRLNTVILVTASNISQPPLTPVILYGSFILGGAVLPRNTTETIGLFAVDPTVIERSLLQYLVGSVILAIILSAMCGVISFALLKVFRKKERLA